MRSAAFLTAKRWQRRLRCQNPRTAPCTSHLGPRTSDLSPITYHLSPITYHLSPITYHLAPRTLHLAPRTARARAKADATARTLSCSSCSAVLLAVLRGGCSGSLGGAGAVRGIAAPQHPQPRAQDHNITPRGSKPLEKPMRRTRSYLASRGRRCGEERPRRRPCAASSPSGGPSCTWRNGSRSPPPPSCAASRASPRSTRAARTPSR
eukprot:2137197-Rhodomonas_salina.1